MYMQLTKHGDSQGLPRCSSEANQGSTSQLMVMARQQPQMMFKTLAFHKVQSLPGLTDQHNDLVLC